MTWIDYHCSCECSSRTSTHDLCAKAEQSKGWIMLTWLKSKDTVPPSNQSGFCGKNYLHFFSMTVEVFVKFWNFQHMSDPRESLQCEGNVQYYGDIGHRRLHLTFLSYPSLFFFPFFCGLPWGEGAGVTLSPELACVLSSYNKDIIFASSELLIHRTLSS